MVEIDDDMADLIYSAARSLHRQGVAGALDKARALVADLRRELDGPLYIKKAFAERNAEIKAAYTGRNAGLLAARYNLSRSRIVKIANNLR